MNKQEPAFSLEKANREQILEGLRNVYTQSGFEVKELGKPETFAIVSKEGKQSKVEFKWQDNPTQRLLIDSLGDSRGNHFVSNAFFDQKTIDSAKKNSITLVDRRSLETAINGLPSNLIPSPQSAANKAAQQSNPFSPIATPNSSSEKTKTANPFDSPSKQKTAPSFGDANPKQDMATANQSNPFTSTPNPSAGMQNATTGQNVDMSKSKLNEEVVIDTKIGAQPSLTPTPIVETKKEIKKRLKQERSDQKVAAKAKNPQGAKKKLSPILLIATIALVLIAVPAVAANIFGVSIPYISKAKGDPKPTTENHAATMAPKSKAKQRTSLASISQQAAKAKQQQSISSIAKTADKVTKPDPQKNKLASLTPKPSKPFVASSDTASKTVDVTKKPTGTLAGSTPKKTGSVPQVAHTTGSTPKPIIAPQPAPEPTAPIFTPEEVEEEQSSTSVFENHIRKSKIRGDKKDYWRALSPESWFEIKAKATRDLKQPISPEEKERIRSYMTVAYLIRGNYEKMTIQLIELNREVNANAVNDLGLTENDFIAQAGKIVGRNNVKVRK